MLTIARIRGIRDWILGLRISVQHAGEVLCGRSKEGKVECLDEGRRGLGLEI